MDFGPADRLALREDLDRVRSWSDRIMVLVPSFVNTDYDPETGGAPDVSNGSGTGRTVAWKTYEVWAVLREVTATLITFGRIGPGVEIGDLLITVSLRQQALMEAVLGNEHAYIYARGERWRPVSAQLIGVGRSEEYSCGLRRHGAALWAHSSY